MEQSVCIWRVAVFEKIEFENLSSILGQGPVEIADADFIERRALTDNSFWLATSLTDWHDNSTEKQERTFACTYKFIAAEIDGRPD